MITEMTNHHFQAETVDPLRLLLDPKNPRLSRREHTEDQSRLLEIMINRFKIDEVAESVISSGYIPLDPILCFRKKSDLVVREGNRRVASIKLLLDPTLAPVRKRKWEELSGSLSAARKESIKEISVQVFEDADSIDVESYIGFRHVNGIMPWPAEEKARFISDLIDSHGWTYQEIAERVGSYPKHIERHYIAYRLICQAEEQRFADRPEEPQH